MSSRLSAKAKQGQPRTLLYFPDAFPNVRLPFVVEASLIGLQQIRNM